MLSPLPDDVTLSFIKLSLLASDRAVANGDLLLLPALGNVAVWIGGTRRAEEMCASISAVLSSLDDLLRRR